MPSEVAEKTQQRTKAFALDIEKRLKALNDDLGPKYWSMAELIYEVHDKQTWQILGHESARSYIETLFISKSGWYAKRRHWQEWSKPAIEVHQVITRIRLNRMPSQNVNQLLRLDDKKRFSPKWVEKALSMKESDFEAAVDHVLENGTEPEGENQPEDRALLKIKCTVSQKDFILESFAEFAKRQDPALELDDEAHILELICADMRAGKEEPMDQDKREAREPKSARVQ